MATTTVTHQTAKTLYITAGDVTYAYRRFGNESTSATPLVFLIHFRGTMDFWDPLLVNTLAATRPVILFDSAGVGKSSGSVPDTIQGMAASAIAFLTALSHPGPVDLLGFSMGGMIAPLVHLNGPPNLIRKLVLAGTSPSAGDGILANGPERAAKTTECATQPLPNYANCFSTIFFTPSPTSQAAGLAWWSRIHERQPSTTPDGEERSNAVSWGYADQGAGLKAMAAAGARFGDPEARAEGSYDRLGEISVPVLIGQGTDDFMIPSHNSWVMQQRIRDARLVVYPDSGHGFLYQYAEEFGGVVARFLDL